MRAIPVAVALDGVDVDEIRRRFEAKVDRSGGPDACWPWRGARFEARGGYGQLTITRRGRVRQLRANRLALFFDGRDPGRLGGLHSCDNPPCCNPAHLFVGDDAVNHTDKAAKGRVPRVLKIADAEVPKILARYASGETCASIARDYGVRGDHVNAICLGRERVAPAEVQDYRPEWKRLGLRKRNARLTDAQLDEIAEEYAVGGVTQAALATRYGVSQQNLSAALLRRAKRRAA